MKKRYIAHWFLGSSNGDSMRSDTIDGLIPFVKLRINSKISGFLCVADLQSKAQSPWLWSKEGNNAPKLYQGKNKNNVKLAIRFARAVA